MKYPNAILTGLLIFAGCGSTTKPVAPPANDPPPATAAELVDEPVAEVGATTITSTQIAQRFRDRDRAGKGLTAELVLDELIAEVVLADEARRRKLQERPEIAEKVQMARYQAASNELEQQLADELTIKESTLEALYHELSDTVRLQLIVVRTEPEARELLARLRAGADPAEEAKHSLNPKAAERGGDMGTVPRGQLPAAVADFAFSATIGEFGGPLEVRYGWAAARVLERTIGDPAGFPARRDALLRHARGQLRNQAKYHFAKQLREQQQVQIDQAFLDATGKRVTPADDEEAAHPVAVVGGVPLRYRTILEMMQESFGVQQGGHLSGVAVKKQTTERLIQQMLLGQAALARGLGNSAEVQAAVDRIESRLIAEELRRQLAESAAIPTAAEIEAYYRDNQDRFLLPARRQCAHIQVADEKTARELGKRIAAGESFEELAKAHSTDSATRARGGLLGTFADERLTSLAKGAEKELARAMMGPVGVVGPPVRSPAGWHLVKVVRELPASARPLEEVDDDIATFLLIQRRQKAIADGIARLREQAGPKVDRAALARLVAALDPL